MPVSQRPSQLLRRIIFTPAMPLNASSIGRVISASTASGAAPGYSTLTKTTGGEMSGSRSTRSCAVGKDAEHAQRGHHHRGEDRVVDRDAGDPHGGVPLRVGETGRGAGAAAARSGLARRHRSPRPPPGARAAHLRRRAFLQVVEARRQHRRVGGRPLSISTRPPATSLRPVMTMRRTRRAVLDRPDLLLAGGLARRPRSARSGAASVGQLARAPRRTGRRAAARRGCRARPPRRSRACRPRPSARCGRCGRRPRSRWPSTRTVTGWPTRAARPRACPPCRPAPASTGRRPSRIGCSAASFSPGTTWRLPTMPEIGATSAASRTPMCDGRELRLRRLAAARAPRRARAWEDCSAVGEMKFWSARRRLAVVLALGLDQLRLRRFDRGAAVGDAALQLGQVDAAERLAGLDAAAFGHAQREQRAGRLGAHHGGARRDQRPGELDRCGIAPRSGRVTSPGANCKVTGLGSVLARSRSLCRINATAPAATTAKAGADPQTPSCGRAAGRGRRGCFHGAEV